MFGWIVDGFKAVVGCVKDTLGDIKDLAKEAIRWVGETIIETVKEFFFGTKETADELSKVDENDTQRIDEILMRQKMGMERKAKDMERDVARCYGETTDSLMESLKEVFQAFEIDTYILQRELTQQQKEIEGTILGYVSSKISRDNEELMKLIGKDSNAIEKKLKNIILESLENLTRKLEDKLDEARRKVKESIEAKIDFYEALLKEEQKRLEKLMSADNQEKIKVLANLELSQDILQETQKAIRAL